MVGIRQIVMESKNFFLIHKNPYLVDMDIISDINAIQIWIIYEKIKILYGFGAMSPSSEWYIGADIRKPVV